MAKITISPRHDHFPKEPFEVDAVLLGGEEGVFACWRKGDTIFLASGDDGGWWMTTMFHKHWLPGLVKILVEGGLQDNDAV
jgi:hypothetical protein